MTPDEVIKKAVRAVTYAREFVDDVAKQLFEAIAESIVNTDETKIDVSNIDDVLKDVNVTVENVTGITGSINLGSVVKELAGQVEDANATTIEKVTVSDNTLNNAITNLKILSIKPTKISFAGESAELYPGHPFFISVTEDAVNGTKLLEVETEVENPANATYTVSFEASINATGDDDKRDAIVKLSEVKVTLNDKGEIEKIEVPKDACLQVSGHDSEGNPVSAKVCNEAGDVIDILEGGKGFKYDLGKVEEKFKNTEGVPSVLKDGIAYPGNYKMSLKITGFPTDIELNGTVEVTENYTPPAPTNIPPEIKEVNPASLSINATENATFEVTVYDPDEGDTVSVTAESDNETVATVSGECENLEGGSEKTCTFTVKGESEGTAKITLTAKDSSGKTDTATVEVTVTKPHVNHPPQISAVKEISLSSNKEKEIVVGVIDNDTDDVTVSYSVDNDSVVDVSWKGDDSKECTVEGGNGNCTLVVTGKSEGNATITLSASDGKETTNATVSVTVTAGGGDQYKDYYWTLTNNDGDVFVDFNQNLTIDSDEEDKYYVEATIAWKKPRNGDNYLLLVPKTDNSLISILTPAHEASEAYDVCVYKENEQYKVAAKNEPESCELLIELTKDLPEGKYIILKNDAGNLSEVVSFSIENGSLK
jgi:uncharacterized protein YjdB